MRFSVAKTTPIEDEKRSEKNAKVKSDAKICSTVVRKIIDLPSSKILFYHY